MPELWFDCHPPCCCSLSTELFCCCCGGSGSESLFFLETLRPTAGLLRVAAGGPCCCCCWRLLLLLLDSRCDFDENWPKKLRDFDFLCGSGTRAGAAGPTVDDFFNSPGAGIVAFAAASLGEAKGVGSAPFCGETCWFCWCCGGGGLVICR